MNFRAVGIGEILWDMLPGGRKLGGAPANFAYHAAALGAEARVISRVGDDELGREILARLNTLSLPTDAIQIDASAPTSKVTVELDGAGQANYLIHENVAWDRLAKTASAEEAARSADVVCFGSLAQRSEPSRSTILDLVRATKADALRIFDINLRQHYYSRKVIEDSLAVANVLKINDAELPTLAETFGLESEPRAQLLELARRFELRVIACTRRDRGSLLLREGRWSDHPGFRTRVADTVGAGDSFTGALALGLLLEWELDAVNERANRVASYVASQEGATPAVPAELRALFKM